MTRRRSHRDAAPSVGPDGKPIKDFWCAWEKTCKDAGYSGKPLHDFRRTAARNLVRAGASEKVATEMTGHKPRRIFDRYTSAANVTGARRLRS